MTTPSTVATKQASKNNNGENDEHNSIKNNGGNDKKANLRRTPHVMK